MLPAVTMQKRRVLMKWKVDKVGMKGTEKVGRGVDYCISSTDGSRKKLEADAKRRSGLQESAAQEDELRVLVIVPRLSKSASSGE